MARMLRWLGRGGVTAMAVAAGAVGTWAAVFGMPITAAWTGLAGLLMLQAGWGRRRALTGAASLLLGIAAVVGWWIPLHELASRLDALSAAKDARGGAAFDLRDRLGVYGLHGWMTVGGFAVGLDEVALEALGLMVPGPPTRDRRSDFALRSPRVRRAVRTMLEEADGGRVPAPRRVVWPGYGTDEPLEVALALNPLVLEGTPGQTEAGPALDLVGTVEVAWPRTYRIPLGRVRGRPLVLDEGLFWVLQEQGWLHPHRARWHFTVAAGDPRLDEGQGPIYGWGERLVRAAGSWIVAP